MHLSCYEQEVTFAFTVAMRSNKALIKEPEENFGIVPNP